MSTVTTSTAGRLISRTIAAIKRKLTRSSPRSCKGCKWMSGPYCGRALSGDFTYRNYQRRKTLFGGRISGKCGWRGRFWEAK